MATRPDPIEEIQDRIDRLEAEFEQVCRDHKADLVCEEVVRAMNAVVKAREQGVRREKARLKELIASGKATPKPR